MENILDRLSIFMIAKELNNNKITNQANLSNGLLGNAFKVGKGLNSDSIEKILTAYPELNAEWFLTGKGEMMKNNQTMGSNNKQSPIIGHYSPVSDSFKEVIEPKESLGYQEIIKTYQEQTDRLISVIDKLVEKYGK